MQNLEFIFWLSLALLFFCYLGYGGLLWLVNFIKPVWFQGKKRFDPVELLPVTIVVPSYNEALVMDAKIRNTLAIKYPKNLLRLIFIVDGSDDESAEIISRYPEIQLISLPVRKGKTAAIKTVLPLVTTPLVVFSDANAMLNEECLQKMVPHFSSPKTGGVAGEKKIISRAGQISPVGEAEGLYWKYESFMKKQDAGFYTVIGAAGELFAARKDLLHELDEQMVLDDFISSMQICLGGYRIAYEPGAFASETASASLAEEEKRKVRIAAGAYQAIGRLRGALNFIRHPLLAFQYTFRRFFRWTLCPLLIIILFFSNLWLVFETGIPGFYFWIFCLQMIFYLFAIAGWMSFLIGKRAGLFTIPFYFVFMNYCLAKGFILYLQGKQTVLWEKSKRVAV
jgi:biofilm PGA synthesis N-glycosyltransferase PgaC